jgi:ATP-dependent Clp protease ATP-binding subunit ClpA
MIRAFDTVRRRGQATLTSEHLLTAFAQVEWRLFNDVAHDVGLTAQAVIDDAEQRLCRSPQEKSIDVAPSPTIRLVCKLALHRSSRAGRTTMEAADLFAALLDDGRGPVAAIFQQHGVAPQTVSVALEARVRERECRDDCLRQRYELPSGLRQVATNLNLLAREDRLPPVCGREAEIRRVIEILCGRDRSSSVMLLGEPGVGKTAVVEGLARQIELRPETVPLRLRDSQIVSLELNALLAGTALRGMFEERLQNVIRDLKEHPGLILFIDEAHTMAGSGAAIGAPADAANILKAALGRGEIRLIAATTTGEYREHLEEDGALARRFHVVHVAEPSVEETRRIINHLRSRLERTYGVEIRDEAIDTALEMSPRYMRHLHLPDKAIAWLDTASVRAEIARRRAVTPADVRSVIADAARLPAELVARDVGDRFGDIEERPRQRVVGQSEAIRAVADRLRLNKGPLKDGFSRPDGVLLFVGPTGVGKTELARALAHVLFGDEQRMVRLDMSEYQDSSMAPDKLLGMPTGVAGSRRGGILTNQLADNPYTVVLLDEIEKASRNVLNVFLQAFDEGWVTDGRGRRVYLSDAMVIMTSNLGSRHFRRLCGPLGFHSGEMSGAQARREALREVEQSLSPEFLNRIDRVVLFDPLGKEEVRRIARRYLAGVASTLAAAGKTLDVDEEALDVLVERGHSPDQGARHLKRTIDERVKVPISRRWSEATSFHVRADGDDVVLQYGGTGTPTASERPRHLGCVA